MQNEDPLRKRYLRFLLAGVVLLLLLAYPAVVHSNAAIESLFNRPSDWVPDSMPEKAEFNRFSELFSVTDLLMIGWEGSRLGSPELERATSVLQPITELEPGEERSAIAIEDVFTAIAQAEGSAAAEQARLQLDQILEADDQPPLRWARSGTDLVEQLTDAPTNFSRAAAVSRLQNSLIGPDGEHTALVLSVSEAGQQQRRSLIPAIVSLVSNVTGVPETEIAIVGGQAEATAVDSESIRTIQRFSPASAIIAALLCLVCLRSVPLTVAIVSVAVVGQGMVLAAVYYTGTPMNAILIVLPPLVFVLTVSAGIHLSNYYLDVAADFPELSRAEAAARAMRVGVPPCCLAAGTTVVGLSSLTLVRLVPVRIFGGVASFGVLLTLVLLFLMLPGAMVLTRTRHRSHSDSRARAERRRSWSAHWMRRRLARPWPVILSFVLIAIGLSVGLTRLETSVNVPRMFRPDSPLRQQFAWFEENIGPTVPGDVLVTFPNVQESDDPLERLALVAQVHSRVLDQPLVKGVLSAVSFVPRIPSGRSLGATAQRSVVRKLIRDPQSSLGQLGYIAHEGDTEIWRISWRMPLSEQSDFGTDLDALRDAAADEVAQSDLNADVSMTGAVVIVQKTQSILLRDLFRSFLTAFAVIAIVMMLVLRSVFGGLLAMVPNLFPTIALFGTLGLLRVPLDIGSVMSASVALGIAVDDTVHLLSRFGSRRARGLGQIRAAFGALQQCFWAMFQTTMVCGVSLMAYWFSDFVPTSRFALFMFGLLATALLGVTLLLPTMMASNLGRWLSHTVGAGPDATLYADHIAKPSDTRRLPLRKKRKDRTRTAPSGKN